MYFDTSLSAQLAFFHGEGPFFSFIIHGFFTIISSALLIYGLRRFRSVLAFLVALAYFGFTLTVTSFAQQSDPALEIFASGLTVPWSMFMPCDGFSQCTSLPLGVAFVCALLNATILYFVVVWFTRNRSVVN